DYFGQCPPDLSCGIETQAGPGENFKAFSLKDQWAPRVGFVWDWAGDGTSKLYGSIGRFYYAIPTDLNVRVYTANSAISSYNYDPNSLDQFDGPHCSSAGQHACIPRDRLFQGGAVDGEPVDESTKAAYQDEATIGVEKALDPTLSLGIKGTYRTLGRTVEDRCDLDSSIAPSSCALY